MSKLLVTKKERMLLLNSEVLKDYPAARKFIMDNPNVKDDDLKYLPVDLRRFFQTLYNKVLKQASQEWQADSEDAIYILDDNEKMKCQLCNHDIKNVCEISNRLNGKKLVVGTECVKHFGMNSDFSIEETLEQKRKIKKLEYLFKYLPNIEKDIDNWYNKLEKYPIMIIDELEMPYIKLGERLKKIYNDYLNDKNNNKYIEQMKNLYDECDKIIKKINTYVNENSDKEFIATRQIEKWLIINDKHDIISHIKKTGVIDWKAAIQIEEPNFINYIIKKFNNYFKSQNIKLKILKFIQGKGLVIEVYYKYKIHVLVSYNEFMMFYGGVLFKQENIEPFDIKSIINKNLIYGDDSVALIISLINNKSKIFGIYIKDLENDIDYSQRDMFLYIKDEDSYVMPKIDQVVKKFKGIALDIDNISINDYINYIKQLKRIHKTDVYEIKKNRAKMGI